MSDAQKATKRQKTVRRAGLEPTDGPRSMRRPQAAARAKAGHHRPGHRRGQPLGQLLGKVLCYPYINGVGSHSAISQQPCAPYSDGGLLVSSKKSPCPKLPGPESHQTALWPLSSGGWLKMFMRSYGHTLLASGRHPQSAQRTAELCTCVQLWVLTYTYLLQLCNPPHVVQH